MLEWRKNNNNWLLFDDNDFVGMVSFGSDRLDYDYGFWNGSFHTSDDGIISQSRIAESYENVEIAKEHIEKCYNQKQTYKWWIR